MMPPTWQDIANDQDYQSLPSSEKNKVQISFFGNVIAKDTDFQSLPDQEKIKVKDTFFGVDQQQPSQQQKNLDFAKKYLSGGPSFQNTLKTLKENAYPIAGATAFGLATGGLGALPAMGMAGLGAGLGQAIKQGKEAIQGSIQPSSEQAAKQIAGQATLGALGEGMGRFAGGALASTGPEMQRIGPAWLRTFGGLKQESGEALVRNPQELAILAQKNPGQLASDNAKIIQEGIQRFGKLIENSNKEFTSIIKEAGPKATPIEADSAALQALQAAQERGITKGSLDPKENLLINRLLSTVDSLSNNTGKLDIKTAAQLRTDLGAQIAKLREYPNVRAVYLEFKTALDKVIQDALPNKLRDRFVSMLNNQSNLRSMGEEILPIIGSKNAPTVIANQLDNPLAVLPSGNTVAQGLQNFDKTIGGNFLEPIRNNIRALPFAEDVVQNLPAGSTGAVGLKAGMSASMLPYVGRAMAPRNLVKGAAFLQKLPQAQIPYTRAGTQIIGNSLFGNQNAPRR